MSVAVNIKYKTKSMIFYFIISIKWNIIKIREWFYVYSTDSQ